MDPISKFCRRAAEISHSVVTFPGQLVSLPEKVDAVAQAVFTKGTYVAESAKLIWNLGPVQTARNITKTFWAALQIVRKPELVFQQVPNAVNTFLYGAKVYSLFYKDESGNSVPLDPFTEKSMELLANQVDLIVTCDSPIEPQQLLNFVNKMVQTAASTMRLSAMKELSVEDDTLRNIERAAIGLSFISTVATVYLNRNTIKNVVFEVKDMASRIKDAVDNSLDVWDDDMYGDTHKKDPAPVANPGGRGKRSKRKRL